MRKTDKGRMRGFIGGLAEATWTLHRRERLDRAAARERGEDPEDPHGLSLHLEPEPLNEADRTGHHDPMEHTEVVELRPMEWLVAEALGDPSIKRTDPR